MEENVIQPQGESSDSSSKKYQLGFHGKGSEYFSIVIVNWLFTVLTLGIYYPWAKSRQLKYLYGASSLNGDRFTFHGTGKEMFRGFILALVILGSIFGLYNYFLHIDQNPGLAFLILYIGMGLVFPFIVHGSVKYRMSRTSWRGIRLGYLGERKTFAKKCYGWLILTIITFGIYGSWLTINMRKYVLEHIRFGNIRFKYKGEGGQYFGILLLGGFLTYLTLGIYYFWLRKNLFEYFVDNIDGVAEVGSSVKFKSTATVKDFVKLLLGNLLLILFTLGLGLPWVTTRNLDFAATHIALDGDIDLDNMSQNEEDYDSAVGEDMGDMLDIDLIL